MQTDIYYRDVTRTENLENFLMERLEAACGDFFKYDSDAHLTVRVETERHRTHNRKPSYTCEVILKPTKSRGVIKIRKSDTSFKRAVALTVASLKTVLRRRSSRKGQHHRTDPMLSLIPEWREEEQIYSVVPA
ncbi:HPF/RaiA family ribosome-associated protein [Bdellovibrio svalbardensis]|uniref:HPF/RaiA family ribosome-associated protein n=1 Tax=Bdellovibrio svalbardensis TaxID=2972972 RepID=A0ABT6DEC8_9BACT|nr:HPF/RaiA family ribosome-associated protein [Bdellovibrio svalbardensis]MDG0815190.1 HPF/RaiA family ribosome-associated protein [Bdellovibrio svalbardensis]